MPATTQLENFFYYKQSLIQKLRAAFNIDQKGTFLKKSPKNFTTPYKILFMSDLHQNKFLHNFRKRGSIQ